MMGSAVDLRSYRKNKDEELLPNLPKEKWRKDEKGCIMRRKCPLLPEVTHGL